MNLLIVWTLTILTLMVGGLIGYLIGSKKIDKKIESIERRFAPKPKESGAVKPYTPEELRDIDNPEHKRINELLR